MGMDFSSLFALPDGLEVAETSVTDPVLTLWSPQHPLQCARFVARRASRSAVLTPATLPMSLLLVAKCNLSYESEHSVVIRRIARAESLRNA